jgi:hypothetical protein
MIQSEARVRFVDFSIIRSLHESLLAVHRSAAGKGLGYAARAGHLRTVEAFIGSMWKRLIVRAGQQPCGPPGTAKPTLSTY